MEHGKKTQRVSGISTYIVTWIALVILAVASIMITTLYTGAFAIVIALIIASVKAALILYIFMHLRHEGRFLKLAFLLPLIVFAFSIGFTFLDVLYRWGR